MANITPDQLLTKVKAAIGITGEYQDDTLEVYIDEVKDILGAAGVPSTVLDSDKVVGTVARGVMDLWNYGAGGGALSPVFYQRILQLKYQREV